uniref:C2h2-type zn-finger protein n=1 Tax=Culex tarsalis TaxID=7177 RepID=A0A1Q3G1B6_CULTA
MEIFQTICRICESRENLCDLTNSLNSAVADKLASLTTIRIQDHDPLPRCICVQCVNTLNVAYEFLLRCEAAEQRLQDQIRQHLKLEQEAAELVDEDHDDDDGRTVEYVVEFRDGQQQGEVEEEQGDGLIEEAVDQDLDEEGQMEEVIGIIEEHTVPVPVKYAIEEYLEEQEVQEDEICFEQEDRGESLDEPKVERNVHDKRFHCETCEASFEKCTELYQHVKTHGKERYKCRQCDRWFSRRAHLQSHEVIHSGERNFSCQTCPNSYKSSRNLRRHIKSAHLGERRFVCDLCGKEFSQKTVLEAHHSTHIQERNYACETCCKRFKSVKLLKLHAVRHTRPEQPDRKPKTRPGKPVVPMECDVCHKMYTNLRSHKQVHSDAKILCTFCGKNFKIMAHLKVHLRSHTKEQPYECKKCNKKFGYESSLKTHLLVHTNERPYKCQQCDQSFRQLNHLKGHKFLHSGEKPFSCVVCKKAFALRGNLTIHMRIHGDPSPYQCRLCEGKRLNDSNALKRHLKAHPGAKLVKTGELTVIVDDGERAAEEEEEEEEEDQQGQQHAAGPIEIEMLLLDEVRDGDGLLLAS